MLLSTESSCTSNHMLGRVIWGKLLDCIFKNFENAQVKQGHFKFLKNNKGNLSPKLPKSNMWSLVNTTKLTKALYRSWYLLWAGNYKSGSSHLQNNMVNVAM